MNELLDVEAAEVGEVNAKQIVVDDDLFVLVKVDAVALGDGIVNFGLILGEEAKALVDVVQGLFVLGLNVFFL